MLGNDLSKQPNSLCWTVGAPAQHRMNLMGNHDIHQAFARALPSQEWCSQPLMIALADVRDWKSSLPDASVLLDTAENLRKRHKRKQDDREALTVSYALHRLLLGHILGMDPAAVPPLWRGAAGCPRVGDNLVHNKSGHAGDWIALVVSRIGLVGVDIEPLARMDMLPEMVETICTRLEHAAMEALAIDDRSKALLWPLWVRKEALLKPLAPGCRWK